MANSTRIFYEERIESPYHGHDETRPDAGCCIDVHESFLQYEAGTQSLMLQRKAEDEDTDLMESVCIEMCQRTYDEHMHLLCNQRVALEDSLDATRKRLTELENQIMENAQQQTEVITRMNQDLDERQERAAAARALLQNQRTAEDLDASKAFIERLKQHFGNQQPSRPVKRRRVSTSDGKEELKGEAEAYY